MWLNQMQEALVAAAVNQKTGKLVTKVAKAADKLVLREPRDNVKLSFRTASKLKNQGVI